MKGRSMITKTLKYIVRSACVYMCTRYVLMPRSEAPLCNLVAMYSLLRAVRGFFFFFWSSPCRSVLPINRIQAVMYAVCKGMAN